MTVNQLITALQKLKDKGHGDLDVAIETPYDDASTKFEVKLSSESEEVAEVYWSSHGFLDKDFVSLYQEN